MRRGSNVSPRDLMSIHKNIIQDSELGDYSQYIIDHKTNNFWKTLSLGIIKEDRIKITKPLDLRMSIYRCSNFKTQSQDFSAYSTLQNKPSQNNLPTTFFQGPESLINLKKRVMKIYNQKWNIDYHYYRDESRMMRIATLDARNSQDGDILYADNQNHINIQGFRRKSCECLIEGQIGSKLKKLGNFQIEVQFHKRKRLANILIENLSQTKRTSTFGKHQIPTMQKWSQKFKGINKIVQIPKLARSSSFEDDSPKLGQLPTKVSFEDGSQFEIQTLLRFSFEDDTPMKIQIPSNRSSQRSVIIRSESRLLTIQSPTIKPNKKFIQQLLEEEDEIIQTPSVHLITVVAPVSIKKLNKAQKNLYYPRPKQMQRNITNISSFLSQHIADNTIINQQFNDIAKISSSARNIIQKSYNQFCYYSKAKTRIQADILPNITIKKNLSQSHLNLQSQKFPEIYTNNKNHKTLFKRNRCYKVKENFLSQI